MLETPVPKLTLTLANRDVDGLETADCLLVDDIGSIIDTTQSGVSSVESGPHSGSVVQGSVLSRTSSSCGDKMFSCSIDIS